MKKIIILTLAIFILASCGQNSNNVVKKTWEKNIQVVKQKDHIVEKNKKNIIDNNSEKTISDIKKSLEKLETVKVSGDDLQMINDNINSIYNSSIIKKALESNDIKICSKLDTNNKKNCEKKVIVKLWDVNKCSNLTWTWEINNCRNKIFEIQANNKMDETICDNIIDNSEEKFQINNCRYWILQEKAIKTLDVKMCNKISEEGIKQMCSEIVKNEKEMKIKDKKLK